ncbi:hypothetical protein C2845_PM11G05510 [Panicum miliaceum]|uniref:Uncharacterized protein n=1 Tax=Panicum miliaceum TaxID=4540 RepID=A0A3L6RQR3_PANMI|nr:hypothetical protein C2845_PM11G05510 [Panicum miliaceum]
MGGCAMFPQLWFWVRVPAGRPEPPFLSGDKESIISPWLDLNHCKAPRKSYLDYTFEIDLLTLAYDVNQITKIVEESDPEKTPLHPGPVSTGHVSFDL